MTKTQNEQNRCKADYKKTIKHAWYVRIFGTKRSDTAKYEINRYVVTTKCKLTYTTQNLSHRSWRNDCRSGFKHHIFNQSYHITTIEVVKLHVHYLNN